MTKSLRLVRRILTGCSGNRSTTIITRPRPIRVWIVTIRQAQTEHIAGPTKLTSMPVIGGFDHPCVCGDPGKPISAPPETCCHSPDCLVQSSVECIIYPAPVCHGLWLHGSGLMGLCRRRDERCGEYACAKPEANMQRGIMSISQQFLCFLGWHAGPLLRRTSNHLFSFFLDIARTTSKSIGIRSNGESMGHISVGEVGQA